MKYTCEIDIDLPRDEVIALFEDRDNMKNWMEGLQSYEDIDGVPGEPGSTMGLHFKMGNRNIDMVETIIERRLPEVFSATYEAKGVWNHIENHFTEKDGGRTHWRIDTEFRCGAFLRVMSWIMPGMFRKQTEKTMSDFKRFAEAG